MAFLERSTVRSRPIGRKHLHLTITILLKLTIILLHRDEHFSNNSNYVALDKLLNLSVPDFLQL